MTKAGDDNLYVIVGLGNPGKDYRDTRHNIGFTTIDLIAKKNNIQVNKIKFKAVYGEGFIEGEKVILVKPQTYMNNSGISVKEIFSYFEFPIENLIVIVDDIDIDFASIRIKKKGSAGTHNGLKSIIYHLKRDDFPRVKIGVGKKHSKQDLANFVLSRFSKDEIVDMEQATVNAAQAIEMIVTHDLNKAMNQYNAKSNTAQV